MDLETWLLGRTQLMDERRSGRTDGINVWTGKRMGDRWVRHGDGRAVGQ